LSVSGNNIAVSFGAGTSTLNNSGTIDTTDVITGSNAGKNRALRNNTAGATITINNFATGLITTAGADVFQMNVAGSSVTFNNYGTIAANGSSDQALNWNILNSNGTTTSYTNTLYNYAGGSITSFQADTVRPGAGGIIYNSGTIKAAGGVGDTSSSDGIDAQVNNSGVTIVNGASQTVIGGITSANLIEGERHGITGGQQTDAADTAGSTGGNKNGVYDLPFTMSITNNSGSTIQGDNGSGVNLDGVDGTEKVTIINSGTITGNGRTGDGDGVDVDGVVYVNNSGTIHSLSASNATYNTTVNGTLDLSKETSEGVTVGGGTIINSGTIEGSATTDARGYVSAIGRGITLAGIDHTTLSGTDTDVPIQKIYNNPFAVDGTQTNATGGSIIVNSGLIKGDSNAGIAIAGSATTGTSYNVTITNTLGGTIEGNSATVAAIDGSAAVGGSVSPVASSNNETIINYGTIKQDSTGKAISLGSGVNSVQIVGGAASVIGDMSGGASAGSNTLTINPSSGQSFSYGGVISNFSSVEIKSGTVTFSGANIYNGTTTIDAATLNLTGNGTIGNTTTLTIASGGTFDLGGGTVNVGTLANSGTINNGTVNASMIGGLTGSGFNKTGTDNLVLSGTNTYTGGTTVSAGKLSVNGSSTGDVNVHSGAELGGHGSVGGTIGGAGAVGPGNSPGILTAASTDPTGGLTYNFEFTQAGVPTWNNPSASGNDVLHLTAALPFTSPLTSANNINLYFAAAGFTYDGGFFTDGSSDDLTANIANATFNYFILDNTSGTILYNGNLYDELVGSPTTSVVSIAGANFGTGTVNGFTEQFTVASVPEPSTYVLLGLGVVGLLIASRRRSLRRD